MGKQKTETQAILSNTELVSNAAAEHDANIRPSAQSDGVVSPSHSHEGVILATTHTDYADPHTDMEDFQKPT
eukprot:scaffold596738_cov19-Prasinocladus_malaysianus.AAC.1